MNVCSGIIYPLNAKYVNAKYELFIFGEISSDWDFQIPFWKDTFIHD